MDILHELMEKELGRRIFLMLKNAELLPSLAIATEQSAVHLLGQIQAILNDSTCDDFDCIEQIVSTLHAAGVSTHRHDF